MIGVLRTVSTRLDHCAAIVKRMNEVNIAFLAAILEGSAPSCKEWLQLLECVRNRKLDLVQITVVHSAKFMFTNNGYEI